MTTGIANSGAALGEGLNAGADFGTKVIGAARSRQQYQQDQSGRQAQTDQINNVADTVPGGEPDQEAAQNASAHAGFLQSLGQGISHIGQGINDFFAGAPAAAAVKAPGATPGAAPASGLPAQPGTAPAPGGAPGAVAMGAPNPQAAPVGLPQAPGAPTMGVAGGAPAYMEDGGPVPQAGGTPNSGAALGAGLNSGADFGTMVTNAARSHQQYQQDQAARQAEAHPIEQFAAHLHSGALDDQGSAPSATPDVGLPGAQASSASSPAQAQTSDGTPQVGLPDPKASQAAAQKGANPAQAAAVGLTAQVAKDPGAQQGEPEDPSKAAHSLTPDWWDQNDKLMLHAASAAAAAGHDPDAVYQSLNHMRTSFVQGHMLRAASAASVALQNGDMDAVEQNLRNMNYYLPDGKDLNVQKDGSGNLVYQNPLQQFIGSDGQPTDNAKSPGPDGKMVANKPNMIPVDQAHIQMLGQAILDPMKVNDTLMATRAAVAKQQLEHSQAQAALNTSEGRLDIGKARLGEMSSTNVKNLSAAQLDQAKAAAGGFALQRLRLLAQNKNMDPGLLKGAQQASQAIDDTLLGSKTSVPIADKNGDPSLSPAAGKVVHDPSTVPDNLKNVTPVEWAQLKSTAQDLYIANGKGGMSPGTAAQIALQVHGAKGQNHKGADGKPQPNAYVHPELGEVGVWNGKSYTIYKTAPNSAETINGTGAAQDQYTKILAGLGGGGGSESGGMTNEESDVMNADDNAPAIEPK